MTSPLKTSVLFVAAVCATLTLALSSADTTFARSSHHHHSNDTSRSAPESKQAQIVKDTPAPAVLPVLPKNEQKAPATPAPELPSKVAPVIAATPVVANTVVKQPKKCVDGTVSDNLSVEWANKATATVHTANGSLLCDDVTLLISSYIMPDSYNGKTPFGGPGTTPQTLFATVRFTLLKGTDGRTTQTVGLPDKCKNVQTDVYYLPEIITVGHEGHGDQFISGGMYQGTGKCEVATKPDCPKPTVPPVVVPPVVTPPVVVAPPVVTPPAVVVLPAATQPVVAKVANTAALPVELPKTGGSDELRTIGLTLVLALITYTAIYTARARYEQ